jgi:hypothetical protein
MVVEKRVTTWHSFPWWSAGTGLVAAIGIVAIGPESMSFWYDAMYAQSSFVYPTEGQVVADILIALIGVSLVASTVHMVRSMACRGASSVLPHGTPLSISLEFTSQVVVSPVLFALYASGCQPLSDTLATRWSGATRNTYTGVCLHTAMDLLGTVLFVAKGQEPIFYLHHAITLGVYGSAALSGLGHYYAALGGLVELTNLFTFCIASGPSVGIAPGSALHTASGALLWLSFTILRMLLHPRHLIAYFNDAFAHPAETLMRHPPLLRYLGGPAYVVIFLMSVFWYIKITKGLIKALSPRADDTAAAAKKGT